MARLGAIAMSIAMGLVLLPTGCADTREPANGPGSGRIENRQDSAYTRYAWTEAREIPDGDRRGLLIGPVMTDNDSSELGGVVLRVDIRHPAPGDLDVWLAYDADGDGKPEVRAPVEFFRSRSEVPARALYACPRSLAGTYFFRDGTEYDNAIFTRFEALPRGHAFYLAVADTLREYAGTVHGWTVYTKTPRRPAAR